MTLLERQMSARVLARTGLLLLAAPLLHAQQSHVISTAGQAAQLDVRVAGEHGIRITLQPQRLAGSLPANPGVAERAYAAPVLSLREIRGEVTRKVGALTVRVLPDPLRIIV